MNCKPGDLAIVVRSIAGNDGKIVRCLRLATRAELVAARFLPYGPVWFVDKKLRAAWIKKRTDAGAEPYARDCDLRPITPPADSITAAEVQSLYQPSPVSIPESERV